jgi:hypothetical protein
VYCEQQHSPLDEDPSAARHLGLAKVLKAMRFYGWTQDDDMHDVAGDSVKVLAVLTGLLHDVPIRVSPNIRSVSEFSYLPSAKVITHSGRSHEFTARNSAVIGGKLPLQTPSELRRMLSGCAGLIGVGLNPLTQLISRYQTNRWWVSFRSQAELDDSIISFENACIDGMVMRATAERRKSLPEQNPSGATHLVVQRGWTYLGKHVTFLSAR